MNFKKTLSLVLIGSQLSLGASASMMGGLAWADAPAAAPSPEMTLLTSVIALQGEKLPSAQMQKQVQGALSQYMATAQPEGSAERSAQALVNLGIYTPAQAQAFGNQLENAMTEISSSQFSSAQEAQQAVEAQLVGIVAEANGAEFSGCEAGEVIGVVGELAGVGLFISALCLPTSSESNTPGVPGPGDKALSDDLGIAGLAMIAGFGFGVLGGTISACGD